MCVYMCIIYLYLCFSINITKGFYPLVILMETLENGYFSLNKKLHWVYVFSLFNKTFFVVYFTIIHDMNEFPLHESIPLSPSF